MRYALGCKFMVLGTENQPMGVVFSFGLRALAAIGVVYATFQVAYFTFCSFAPASYYRLAR